MTPSSQQSTDLRQQIRAGAFIDSFLNAKWYQNQAAHLVAKQTIWLATATQKRTGKILARLLLPVNAPS